MLVCAIKLLKGIFWTHFEIHLGISACGELVLALQGQKLPSILILQGLKALLEKWVHQHINKDISYLDLGLETHQRGHTLHLRPFLRGLVIPIRTRNYIQFSGLRQLPCSFRRDADRNLQVVFTRSRLKPLQIPSNNEG